jgi:type I restriction enzyme S subunit|tara:strand:- start:875 stop:1099 length:225 start_codon:yes stop_codon:yes gene_type:complete
MGNVVSGTIQKFIGLGALRNMPILIDEATIIRFEETTEHIFKKLTFIKLENQKLTELRDWLLPMLMNGQVTVKD